MYYCCKSCAQGCEKCCDEICRACHDCCECITDIFEKPFSFISFIAFIFCGGPFLLGVIVYGKSQNLSCEYWLPDHLLCMAILNLVNFFFCLYLFCSYGRHPEKFKSDKYKDKNALEITGHLILYDFGVCFYLLIYLFEWVWIIIGHEMYKLQQEEDNKLCLEDNDGILKTGFLLNIIILDIYLVISLLLFVVSVIYYACKDDSCYLAEFCHCCCMILTCGYCCGCCNVKKPQKQHQNVQKQNKFVKKASNVYDGMGWNQNERQNAQKYQVNQPQYPQQNQYYMQNPQQIQMQQQPQYNHNMYNYPQMNDAQYQQQRQQQIHQKPKKKKAFYQVCWD